MALQDFIQSLQDSDTVYSTPPQPTIQVIPPETASIKVIPPESKLLESSTPKKIKLKLKVNSLDNNTTENHATENHVIENHQIEPNLTTVNNNTQDIRDLNKSDESNTQDSLITENKPIDDNIPKYNPTAHEVNQESAEDLFLKTGTEIGKRDLWMSRYKQALASRKTNIVAQRMKLGRFTITPDDKVLILPDYDVVNKDPDDILNDKWL